MDKLDKDFLASLKGLQEKIFKINNDNGWNEESRTEGDIIALFHSEVSEALEAFSHGNPQSEKIPDFSSAEEEYADLVIRIMDDAERRNYDLGSAILAKLEYNKSRGYKHGGKKF